MLAFPPSFGPNAWQSTWSREEFIQRRQQQVDGTVLKVDGSHKLVKFVRVFDSQAAGGTRPVHCIITFFNEFEQVGEI